MALRLNGLSPASGARFVRVRVGRGIGCGLGKTAGRGHKGSFARKGGGKIKAGFEGGQTPMQRRLPKIGFRSALTSRTAQVLSYKLDALESGEINLALLRLRKMIPWAAKKVKVVRKGRLTKAFVFNGVEATAGARVMIEAAGGSFKE
ncbi:MAG TPA: 50S ribosomal protein L15 [Xylella sp.]